MSAATFTTLVTSYCEKLGAASDVAELDALDLTLDSDYPRFRKKDFDELMAKCKVEVARDNYDVGDHTDLIISSIAQFYVATVKISKNRCSCSFSSCLGYKLCAKGFYDRGCS
jgi:hypothetical protein